MAGHHQKPHAIMIPYPYQGHVTPFVYLAIKLASRGFTITFVNTHYVHSQISKSQANNHKDDIVAIAKKSGLDIRYATLTDGFPLGFDRSLNHDQFKEGILHVFPAHVDELVGNLVASDEDPPVTCMIADTFFTWTSVIADKYNLVNVSFWTEPALVLSLYYHIDLLKKNGHFANSNDNREDTIDYIPGVKAIEQRDLTSYLQSTDIWTVMHRIIYIAFEDVKNADIIICNTVQELEPETLAVLNMKQPVYAIGPIFPSGFSKNPVTTSLLSEADCSHWLNSKPDGSVLYVSFGSYAHTNKADIVEIAHGLMLSGVSFVWVVRPDIVSSEETNFLPPEFEQNVGNRGLVVPWCRQTEVISHPSIRGFLTHCGWNSILESIWCGIPLICYPLVTDQFSNRKLVVNDWKIGINLCDKTSITRQEVVEKINVFMSGKSVELKNAVLEVKSTLKNALAMEGTSQKNMNRFVEDVKAHAWKRFGLGLSNGSSNGHVIAPLKQAQP
ncbi:UDP-glycosyltransferase 86A1-like [Ipomoea triloba]|uniref:UDP-glycosyltransferase 86A1-like n=1 Tax=Ipomoea triloba TaxID=35885 RepID=UPI00125E86F9|nr:UDP-glycosyltransferase 86A1-like [Ipomoea triloba]